MKTAQFIAECAKENNPHIQYGYSTDDTTVGAFRGGRWIAVAGRVLTGGFAVLPVELLVNGVNPTDSLEFVAV